MDLECEYFKVDFHYRVSLVNKYILIIKGGGDEKRVNAFKNLVFKMMKFVVQKNISNFINLLRGTHLKDDLPERVELISECFIVFNKCLEKYVISEKSNFYFYYNTSLSRNFFREYQRELKRSNSLEISEALMTVHPSFHVSVNDSPYSVDLVMYNLRLTELEKKVCHSRMLGQRTSEFLKENPEITSGQYSKTLRRLKEVLIDFKKDWNYE